MAKNIFGEEQILESGKKSGGRRIIDRSDSNRLILHLPVVIDRPKSPKRASGEKPVWEIQGY